MRRRIALLLVLWFGTSLFSVLYSPSEVLAGQITEENIDKWLGEQGIVYDERKRVRFVDGQYLYSSDLDTTISLTDIVDFYLETEGCGEPVDGIHKPRRTPPGDIWFLLSKYFDDYSTKDVLRLLREVECMYKNARYSLLVLVSYWAHRNCSEEFTEGGNKEFVEGLREVLESEQIGRYDLLDYFRIISYCPDPSFAPAIIRRYEFVGEHRTVLHRYHEILWEIGGEESYAFLFERLEVAEGEEYEVAVLDLIWARDTALIDEETFIKGALIVSKRLFFDEIQTEEGFRRSREVATMIMKDELVKEHLEVDNSSK